MPRDLLGLNDLPTSPVSICLDDSPVLGGLSRGIRDLSLAVGGPIVSLDSGRLPPATDDGRWRLVRIAAGAGPLTSRHLRLSRRSQTALEAAIAGASAVICHSLYRAHLPFVRRVCLALGTPYWIVAHGMLDPWVVARRAAFKRAWLRWCGEACFADAAGVLFATESERRKAEAWVGSARTAVIPWPVDAPVRNDEAQCRAAWRRRLGIPAEDRILLWLSRFDTLKRPVHTIQAFCRAARPGWHLVMAGYEGDMQRAEVIAEARRAGGGQVHVLAPVEADDKRQLLLASDAFVSLSFRESFGYALADAIATGLPFGCAPDHDLVGEIPAECARWVAADHSIESAEQCVRQLLNSDSAARAAAGSVGRDWVIHRLSRRAFCEHVTDMICRGNQSPLNAE